MKHAYRGLRPFVDGTAVSTIGDNYIATNITPLDVHIRLSTNKLV